MYSSISELQVYIQHYIQHLNVVLYIRFSMSIFSTIFKLRSRAHHSALQFYILRYIQQTNVELYIRPSMSIFSTILTSECRALYSAFLVYIQDYIQHPNVELYIRLSPGFNCWFSSAPVFQWCCSTPQGLPGVGRNTFLSSPHLCFIIVFICDLFVSRDDQLMS